MLARTPIVAILMVTKTYYHVKRCRMMMVTENSVSNGHSGEPLGVVEVVEALGAVEVVEAVSREEGRTIPQGAISINVKDS